MDTILTSHCIAGNLFWSHFQPTYEYFSGFPLSGLTKFQDFPVISRGSSSEFPDIFHYYLPQTKFGKVMFLHLSVILFMGGGLPRCMLGYTPQEQTPLGADTPHPGADTPPAQCMLGDTGNKRVVRILLECILVLKVTSKKFFWIKIYKLRI